jgi:5-methylcytosine-specific restriction endonuclease McrA
MPTCTKCFTEKPVADFYADKSRASGHYPSCRGCVKARVNTKYATDGNYRERVKANTRATVAKDPEKKREGDRQYRIEQGDAYRAKKRAYYAANRTERRAQQREYRNANIEVERERTRIWTQDHREEKRAMDRAYQKTHPEVYRASRLRRKARKANAAGTATTAQVEARIAYYGHRCWMCGGPFEHVDHVIPLARGGTNWPANLRPACATCNLKKGAKPYTSVTRKVTADAS